MNRTLAAVLSSAALAALLLPIVAACSSGGSSSSSGYTLTNCPNNPLLNGSSTTATCLQCVESKCSSQVSAVNSACASTFACACPAGVDAAACPSQQLPDGGETACTAALGLTSVGTLADGGFGLNATGFFGCALTNCAVQCAGDAG